MDKNVRVADMAKQASKYGLKIVSRPRGPVKIHNDDSNFRTLRNSSGMVKGV